MTDHPLTDEIMERIALNSHWSGDTGDVVFRWDDMRAAADWQLAQCLNYIRLTYGDEAMVPFMEAMRPQVNNS